MKKRFCKKD